MWQSGTMEPFMPRINAIIDSVIPESPAKLAGFVQDDKIIGVNNIQVKYWDEFTSAVKANPEDAPMEIEVNRSGF